MVNCKKTQSLRVGEWLKITMVVIILLGMGRVILGGKKIDWRGAGKYLLTSIYGSPPLVMEGGDPYIRALMRTISFSESNYPNPYHVIYGGRYVKDLSRHPNLCVEIESGPNRGKCTTASGRYQFLNTTWQEKAAKYHPHPSKFLFWKEYSFEPKYQDLVLYNWLTDKTAWGEDIPQLLREGKIDRVLKILSPVWTSLGYGIEDNSMSKYLPQVYQRFLREELSRQLKSSRRKTVP